MDLNNWSWFRFIVFDNPASNFHDYTFEDRYGITLEGVPQGHSFVMVSSRIMCTSNSHIFFHPYKFLYHCHSLIILLMKSFANQILRNGGEGVILRYQKSCYQHGESNLEVLLKVAHLVNFLVFHIGMQSFENNEALVTEIRDSTYKCLLCVSPLTLLKEP
jgi:hypothetical protein